MVALSELRGFAEDREENVVGKREIACKKAISPVLVLMFSTLLTHYRI